MHFLKRKRWGSEYKRQEPVLLNMEEITSVERLGHIPPCIRVVMKNGHAFELEGDIEGFEAELRDVNENVAINARIGEAVPA